MQKKKQLNGLSMTTLKAAEKQENKMVSIDFESFSTQMKFCSEK